MKNFEKSEYEKLNNLLKFILNEIWVDELDLKDFHPIIGFEKEEVMKKINTKTLNESTVINLLGSICGYPFDEKYEKKCEEVRKECEFFLNKMQKI